jgi:hypothetical protein
METWGGPLHLPAITLATVDKQINFGDSVLWYYEQWKSGKKVLS